MGGSIAIFAQNVFSTFYVMFGGLRNVLPDYPVTGYILYSTEIKYHRLHKRVQINSITNILQVSFPFDYIEGHTPIRRKLYSIIIIINFSSHFFRI